MIESIICSAAKAKRKKEEKKIEEQRWWWVRALTEVLGLKGSGTDQNTVGARFFVKLGGQDGQQVHLGIAVVAPREDDVLEDGLGVDVEALGDLAEAFRAAVVPHTTDRISEEDKGGRGGSGGRGQ